MRTWIWTLLLAAGCAGGKESSPVDTGPEDRDLDGFPAATDCNDGDPSISPSGTETCDGKDNNCDGSIDEDPADALVWFVDADSDGYGATESRIEACDRPTGHVPTGDDCDDAESTVFPGASEACDDPVDRNCDGSIAYADADSDGIAACFDCDDADAGVSFTVYYQDDDGDNYGADGTAIEACSLPEGYAETAGDCDDFDDDINPGIVEDDCDDAADYSCDGVVTRPDRDADGTTLCDDCDDDDDTVGPDFAELCDEKDNDCDGQEDEDPVDPTTWYVDADGDGFGNDLGITIACDAPRGSVALGGDCDDDENDTHPGASETDCADPTDYNCDGSSSYTDADGDGWAACEECDDANPDANPSEDELCNGIDDDCDGDTDEDDADDVLAWYQDADGDGFGDSDTSLEQCDAPTGYVLDDTDCDDTDGTIYPDAPEWCNDIDDDCSGGIDDAWAVDAPTWYADDDRDGYGDPADAEVDCDTPRNFVSDGTDCDDTDGDIHPGVTEVCDGVDEDCDGAIDDSATDATEWYADTDADGYGDLAAMVTACTAPTGHVANQDDCDDLRADVAPGGTEVCDGADNDCDTSVDDGATDAIGWHADADYDGFGASAVLATSCTAPAGAVADGTDCDDTRADTYPGGIEVCDDRDQDCDGTADDGAIDAPTWYVDQDRDTYGSVSTGMVACDAPTGTVASSDDCDDLNSAIYPAAPERCNSLDDDCDAAVDEGGSLDPADWYLDLDADGFGDPGTLLTTCTPPTGYVANNLDCDDSDPAVHPTTEELCNGVDDDCDGLTDEDTATDVNTWYADLDDDSFGDADTPLESCTGPAGYVLDASDCDDNEAAVFPGAIELCNLIDDDCDGAVDTGAVDTTTLRRDDDADGYGDPSSGSTGCSGTPGYVNNDDDCDDSRADVHPDADEACNGIDDDCDGVLDGDNATNMVNQYPDNDGDGYGQSDAPELGCDTPPGYSLVDGDCDDGIAAIHPDIEEVCGDGVDNNCDESFSGCGWLGSAAVTVADGTWTGYAARDNLAYALDGAGDVNGDGYDDLIFGAYNADLSATGAGRAYVVFGPAIDTTLPAADVVIDGGSTTDNLGKSVAGVGDVDRDGYDDVVVGAPGYNNGLISDVGVAVLLRGGPSGYLGGGPVDASYIGPNLRDYTGSAVSDAGDIDGDGLGEFLVGANGYDPGGAIAVISGASWYTRDLRFAPYLLTGVDALDLVGTSLAGGGDLDGDGIDDLIAPAPGHYVTGANTGAVYVFYGPPPTAADIAAADVEILGEFAGDAFGTSIAVLGDFDEDGFTDLTVGAPAFDGLDDDIGRVWVFAGPYGTAMTTANASVVVQGLDVSDRVGDALAGPGDVDQDGADDLLIAAGGLDDVTSNEGGGALFYGPVTGTVTILDADAILFGAARLDAVNRVAGAGDTNADGYPDFLLGSYNADSGGTATGSAYLFLGSGL